MDILHDKLTKFLAVGGLALLIASATFAYTTLVNRQQEWLRIFDLVSRMERRIKARRMNEQALPPLLSEVCNVSGDDGAKKECLSKRTDALLNFFDVVEQRSKQSREDLKDMSDEITVAELFREKFEAGAFLYRTQLVFGANGIFVGGLIAVYGFTGWMASERAGEAAARSSD